MIKERLRYAFDGVMSKGIISSIFLLILFSTFVVFTSAVVVTLLNIHPEGSDYLGFTDAFWASLMRTLDPGTMGDDKGWSYRIMMLIVTGYGILMLSTFIGLISNGILSKITQLRKGRSKVLVTDHVMILGWSPKIQTIVSELVIANENQRKPVIVILAEKDKVEMEDSLKENIPDTKNTRVICRSGNPIDVNDLEIANPCCAKSIIILDREDDNSDAEIIKIILAITTSPNRKKEKYHITAAIKNPENMEVAKMVGRDEVEIVLSDEFISKIMVQTSRQSGLSIVYTDFLDFAGDEIYFSEEPNLYGKTFREALFSYNDSSIIGLLPPDETILINPPADSVITKGTQLIAISEDDDCVIMSKSAPGEIDTVLINEKKPTVQKKNKILILGWNRRAEIIIKELALYLNPGSSIKVLSEIKNGEKVIDKLNKSFSAIEISYQKADTTDRDTLEGLNVQQYDHLLLLSYQERYDIQQADSKTLISLLHLRNIAEKSNISLSIVSEMLDVRNRELARVTDADDFIISDNIISLLMAQVSENKHLMRVFDHLFQASGSEVYLKPVDEYVKSGYEMAFYVVLEAALRKDQIAIGYRQMKYRRDTSRNFGVVLNPVKSDHINFDNEDLIIVLAED
ncbi:potassium transporter TrkA [Bacteroidota bacterium]